jgi:hypothetical protein
MQKVATQCLNLGLTVQETAQYLGITDAEVEASRRSSGGVHARRTVFTTPRILVAMLLIVGLLTLSRHVVRRGVDIPQTRPVHGRVLYEDGSTVPVSMCELTFHAVDQASQGRKRVGRAVLNGVQGEMQRVCYDAKYPGLPLGVYKVTVRLPGQVPLPSYIVAPEYGDSTKTPLSIEANEEPVVLQIKRPKELLERFDRDANGSLDAVERAAVREAALATMTELSED